MNDKLLEFEPLLEVIIALLLLRNLKLCLDCATLFVTLSQISTLIRHELARSNTQELGHESLMRNKFQPGKGKGRVFHWVYLNKQIC